MADLRFEWDPRKDATNRQKHGVSFEEAQTVFFDERGLILADPQHSGEEDRFILIGLSSGTRILVVVHCYRKGREVIRIISARRASRRESRQYAERWTQ